MKQLTVTEAARKFHEVIQEVEADGQEFVVVRKAQAVARDYDWPRIAKIFLAEMG